MCEDPTVLKTEATRVLADCKDYLEVAYERVLGISARREKALKDLAAARELHRQRDEELSRVLRGDLGEWYEAEAEAARQVAYRQVSRANNHLASDDLDTEYQKAVARQIAGLLRDDSLERLDYIATRSDKPELQRTIAEYKAEVARITRGVINRFSATAPLLQEEVRKARVEAGEILARLKNPPVD